MKQQERMGRGEEWALLEGQIISSMYLLITGLNDLLYERVFR